MMYYANTVEEFQQIKAEMKPVYVKSKTTGKDIEIPCMNTILVKHDLNNFKPFENGYSIFKWFKKVIIKITAVFGG